MFQRIKNQTIEGIYYNDVYCLAQKIKFNDKEYILTITYSEKNELIDDAIFYPYFTDFPSFASTGMGKSLSRMIQDGEKYINKDIKLAYEEFNRLKEIFLERNQDLEGEQLKANWNVYRIANMESNLQDLIDVFKPLQKALHKRIKNKTYDLTDCGRVIEEFFNEFNFKKI